MKKNFKLVNAKKTYDLIVEYQSKDNQPTMLGFLNHLGITWDEWLEIQKTNHPSVRVIKMFEQHLCEQLEKMILYKNPKTVNTGAIIFLLKKTNPLRYGDKSIELVTKTVNPKTTLDDLKNESEIDLMKLSVC